jgi:putative two-component system response regulator
MKIKAISIDDEEINLLMLEEIAKTIGVDLVSFMDPLKAVEHIKKSEIDLVFVDYLMPGIDGIEMIRIIRKYHNNIPIVMITALSDRRDLKISALEAGATDFLSKPVDSAEFIARTKNLIELRKFQLLQKERADLLEDEVRKATKDILEREFESLTVLGKAAEYKDPETANHIVRVAYTSKLIAAALGLTEKQQELIFHAAPLHDVGKMGIQDLILLKPGPLSSEEYKIMQSHSYIGSKILKGSKSIFLQAGAEIALTHHERYAGGGYPRSLKGKEIPLFGRIVTVADSFDAMITRRPYKAPWPADKVIAIIEEEKGQQFDPEIVEAFLGIIDSVIKLYEQFQD